MWINDRDICVYNKDQQYKGDLYYIIDWFCDKIEYILGYDIFPLPVKGDTALEILDNANEFDSDSDLEVDLWYAAKSRWTFNHCWFIARGGAVLPCVYFRRVEDLIEISWDNSFWRKENIIFNSQKDVFQMEFNVFSEIMTNFLFTVISDLEKRTSNIAKIKELKEKIRFLNWVE